MHLVLDSKDKVMAVWTALAQFVENQVERDDGDPVPPEEAAALDLLQQLDEAIADQA